MSVWYGSKHETKNKIEKELVQIIAACIGEYREFHHLSLQNAVWSRYWDAKEGMQYLNYYFKGIASHEYSICCYRQYTSQSSFDFAITRNTACKNRWRISIINFFNGPAGIIFSNVPPAVIDGWEWSYTFSARYDHLIVQNLKPPGFKRRILQEPSHLIVVMSLNQL